MQVEEHVSGRSSLATAVDQLEGSDPVPAFLQSLDASALRELVLTLAEHRAAAEMLQLLAAMNTGRNEDAEQAIKAAAQKSLRTPGYVDYRRSFEASGWNRYPSSVVPSPGQKSTSIMRLAVMTASNRSAEPAIAAYRARPNYRSTMAGA